MRTGQIPEFIIVFVNAGGDTFYADSPDKRIPSETAFIRELIPHVDATYRTLPDRSNRAIEGFSMGGFGALALSFKHAELFGSVVAYAPALVEVQPNADGALTLGPVGGRHEGGSQRTPEALAMTLVTFREMFGGDPAVFTAHSPFTTVSQDAARLREMLPVRTVVGTADGLLNANEQFHDVLVGNAYYHEYFVVKDIAHNLARLYERLGLDGLVFHARAGGWREAR
jgi:S-formylglutathione hydrolase FrmB